MSSLDDTQTPKASAVCVSAAWRLACRPVADRDELIFMRHPLSRRVSGRSLIIGFAVLAGACADNTVTTPTAPTTTVTTDTFSGTFDRQGMSVNPFTVGSTGTVTISLIDVEPLTNMALGVAIGTWDGTNCNELTPKNDNVRTGSVALNGIAGSGSYCVKVYDSGNVPPNFAVIYTVQVAHP
jgi:hypothetical protein